MRISDWSSDVCSSDLTRAGRGTRLAPASPPRALPCSIACCISARTSTKRRRSARPRSSWTLTARRSEEHTSELQSLMRSSYAVFCLKKNIQYDTASFILITLTTLHRSCLKFPLLAYKVDDVQCRV